MPFAYPEEFRRRVIELARASGQSTVKISKHVGSNEQMLRNESEPRSRLR